MLIGQHRVCDVMQQEQWRWNAAPGATKRMRRLFLFLLALITVRLALTAEDSCRRICGRRPLAPSYEDSIGVAGGTDALPGTWPWMVSIRAPFRSGYQHTCGGSLITTRWILTAAHCFNETSPLTSWQLMFGATELSRPGPDAQVRSPKRMVKHENYQSHQEINDIALIELDTPVQCNNYIQPACLPGSSVDVSALTDCFVAGWGYTREQSVAPSDILKEAKVDLIPTDTCNSSSWYYGSIRTNNLCAGFEGGGIDTCQGDAGGPLMCRRDESKLFWVIGVTSWGTGCARARKPGVYTSTQNFYEWIRGHVKEDIAPRTTTHLPPLQPPPAGHLQAQPPPQFQGEDGSKTSGKTARQDEAQQPASRASSQARTSTLRPATSSPPQPQRPAPPRWKQPPKRNKPVVSSVGYFSSWDESWPRFGHSIQFSSARPTQRKPKGH
ncbi:acrosin-like [Hemicordylus capensis]|uniref:acrosin-like n=1 Tax=Hemicordylus capensis TaxID=884348 RepID=UPI002303B909|nr:acrosin-like [Hemicordylus capensis]